MVTISPEGGVCRSCHHWREQRDFYLRNERTGNRFSRCRFCTGCTGSGGVHDNWYQDRYSFEKQCGICARVLSIGSFTLLNPETGKRRKRCRDCHNAATLAHKLANREKVKASNAAYREARRVELTERQRAWREANPERYLKIHSGWRRRNPDAARAIANKRRVLLEQAGPHYTAIEWKTLKAEYNHRCLMCHRQEPQIRLTVDHIIPISLGGSNSIDNLQPLCQSCNSKKYRGILDLRPLKQTELLLE